MGEIAIAIELAGHMMAGMNRFDDAMGEARETFTGLGMAQAFEYVDATRCELARREVDRVVGALYVLANRRGG